MRERIYTLVQKAKPNDKLSRLYDFYITITAFVSITPLLFKETTPFLDMLDTVTVYLLFLDYILRWLSYDYAGKFKSPWAFLVYPFTPYAILDFISLLPSLGLIGQGFRILRMLRLFKIFHYYKSFIYIGHAFQKERKVLCSVLMLAIIYIFISALAMFTYEPDTFDNFFDALYWATTALTTVGYGDVYPVTNVGKFISMLSSLFGVAIIALPAGTITASFVEEMNRSKEEQAAEKAQELASGRTSVLTRVLRHIEKEDAHEDEQ